MNKERLLRLAEHLDSVPPEQFDLSSWKCGSTACAVGHACSIPEFQAAGLNFDHFNQPRFFGATSWNAVGEFFDIEWQCGRDDATAYLFMDDSYPNGIDTTAAEVAARIRSFVAAGGQR